MIHVGSLYSTSIRPSIHQSIHPSLLSVTQNAICLWLNGRKGTGKAVFKKTKQNTHVGEEGEKEGLCLLGISKLTVIYWLNLTSHAELGSFVGY